MKEFPTVTACILTYNSESTIKRAVESVLPFVDQVVIVDSGSIDETRPILASLGLEVVPFSWCDDFSVARNKAIEHASSDWILFLDSDETFHWNVPGLTLSEYLQSQADDQGVYVIPCRNIEEATGELLLVSHAERLFPRGKYRYQGAIHEALTGPDKTTRLLEHGVIEHVGYSAGRMNGKSERNLRMLERELEKNPENGKVHRYLANEYFNIDRYKQSIEHAKRALALVPSQDVYVRAQAYYYWMASWFFQGERDQALRVAQQAIQELPSYSDPYAIVFEIAFAWGEWQTAIEMFDRWEALVKTEDVLPRHFAGYLQPFCIKREQAQQFSQKNSGERLVYQMKLSIAVMGLCDSKELLAIKQHLDTLPLDYQLVLVGTADTAFLKQEVEQLGGVWNELPVSSTTAERQKQAMQVSREEWTLFLTAGDRVADGEAFVRLLEQAAKEEQTYYAAEVTYASDRLLYATSQVRLVKRGLNLAAVESPDESPVAFKVLSRLLYTNLQEARAGILNPMLTADVAHLVLADIEIALRNALHAFAKQEYEQALRMMKAAVDQQGLDVHYVRAFQFYMVLCHTNLGQANAALELLQDVINEDEEEAIKDFCALYAKMVTGLEDEEVKQEAIELIREVFGHYQGVPGRFTDLDDAELLIIAGDLHMQLGQWGQAKQLFMDALTFSNFDNERAAYRYGDAMRQLAERDHQIAELPRKLMSELNLGSPKASRILYLLFRYLGLDEWAILFYSFHESARYVRPQGKASVILPVYNQREYLAESIRSVLRQTYTCFELIIVDDGSTDNIQEIVDEFWYDRRIRYHRLDTNQGLPNALNAGLGLATGEFVTWHSADNFMHDNLLERLIAALEAAPDKIASFANYRQIDEDGLILEKRLNRGFELNGLATPGPAFLWRAENGVGGFDPELYGIEDRDFAIRMRMEGNFVLVPEILYSYRIHGESLSAEIAGDRFGGWSTLHEKLKEKWFFWNFV